MTVIDAADGSLRAIGAESGVPIHHAVAASTCVPGLFPPVVIDGRRYVDGGMGTATHAELGSWTR